MICIASRNPHYLHPKHNDILYFIDSDNQEQYYKNVNYLITPGLNLQEKRNDILQYCRDNDIEHLIMCDDDVDYFRDNHKNKVEFIDGCKQMIEVASENDLSAMMLTQDVFIYNKINAPMFSNCTKLAWCVYLNIRLLKDILYDETPDTFEDVDIALQILYRKLPIKTYNKLAAHMIVGSSRCFDADSYRIEFIRRLCKLYIKWGDVLNIYEQKRFPKSPYGFRLKLDNFYKWTKRELAQKVVDNPTDESIDKFLKYKDNIGFKFGIC